MKIRNIFCVLRKQTCGVMPVVILFLAKLHYLQQNITESKTKNTLKIKTQIAEFEEEKSLLLDHVSPKAT